MILKKGGGAKMLKVYRINIVLPIDPQPLPLKEYVLSTRFNIDNYGRPLGIDDNTTFIPPKGVIIEAEEKADGVIIRCTATQCN